jgi:hypothetical protein
MLFVGMGLAWVAYATGYYGVMVLKGTSGPGVSGGLSLKQVLSPVGYYNGSVSPFKPGAAASATGSTTAAPTAPQQNAQAQKQGSTGAGSTTSTQHTGPGVANNK